MRYSMSFKGRPWTPPAALMSAMAIRAPLWDCWPDSAYRPTVGKIEAIRIEPSKRTSGGEISTGSTWTRSGAGAPARGGAGARQAARADAARRAITGPRVTNSHLSRGGIAAI